MEMSVFEAATILMEIAHSKCDSITSIDGDSQSPSRKRKNAESATKTILPEIPKWPRNVKKSRTFRPPPPQRLRVPIIPKPPMKHNVKGMKSTSTTCRIADVPEPPMKHGDMKSTTCRTANIPKPPMKHEDMKSTTRRTADIPKPPMKHEDMKSTTSRNANIPKPPRKQKAKEMKLTATPEMPAALRDRIAEIGGYEVKLVIQKQLHDTDMNKNHGRLSLPIQKLRFDFTTEEERKLLNQHDDKKSKKGMNVMIIDPLLRESVICLKKWKIGSGDVYCLMTHWNSFAQQNCLRSGDVVQVWSFRKDGVDVANETDNAHHLCFAMVKPDVSLFL